MNSKWRPSFTLPKRGMGRGDTPCNNLYAEAPPERGTFFKLQVYKRVGISQVEVYDGVEEFRHLVILKHL